MRERGVLTSAIEELLLIAQEEDESTKKFAGMEQRQQWLVQRS